MSAAKHILIVDDDVTVSTAYQRQFVTAGYRVDVLHTGETALEWFKTGRADLVLLDLQLPGVTGIEVLNFIRAQPTLVDLPVVVFSNAYLGHVVQAAWKAGASKCLTKAICTPKQLLEVVRSSLNPATAKSTAPPDLVGLEMRATRTPRAVSAPTTATVAEKPVTLVAPLSVAVPVAAPMAMSPASVVETDSFLQDEGRQAFLDACATMLVAMRGRLQALMKAENQTDPQRQEEERRASLAAFYDFMHALTGKAGVAGFHRAAVLSSAFEAFLKELHDKPKRVNPSVVRTVANTLDLLGTLLTTATGQGDELSPDEAAILVVDDEPISRRSVMAGLEKAGLHATGVEDPLIALAKLTKTPYDVIFLDVQMPGMTGFELCTKLRAMPLHAKTPVVFVTAMTDFQSRARSTLSGGNDLIGKPFLLMELAVKALSYVLRAKPPA